MTNIVYSDDRYNKQNIREVRLHSRLRWSYENIYLPRGSPLLLSGRTVHIDTRAHTLPLFLSTCVSIFVSKCHWSCAAFHSMWTLHTILYFFSINLSRPHLTPCPTLSAHLTPSTQLLLLYKQYIDYIFTLHHFQLKAVYFLYN